MSAKSIARKISTELGTSFIPTCSEHGEQGESTSRRKAAATITSTYCLQCRAEQAEQMGERREQAMRDEALRMVHELARAAVSGEPSDGDTRSVEQYRVAMAENVRSWALKAVPVDEAEALAQRAIDEARAELASEQRQQAYDAAVADEPDYDGAQGDTLAHVDELRVGDEVRVTRSTYRWTVEQIDGEQITLTRTKAGTLQRRTVELARVYRPNRPRKS